MNPNFTDLENELKELQPKSLSETLQKRLSPQHISQEVDLLTLEKTLFSLAPKPLSNRLLDDLASSTKQPLQSAFEYTPPPLPAELSSLEASLSTLQPAKLSPSLLKELVTSDPEPSQALSPKVVPKAAPKTIPFPTRPKSSWPMMRAAALVALLGVLSALIVSKKFSPSSQKQIASQKSPSSLGSTNSSRSSILPETPPLPFDPSANLLQTIHQQQAFTPVSQNRQFVSMADDGIIHSHCNQPMRCIRLEYQDQRSYKNDQGHHLEVKQPAIHYYIVPVHTD